MPEVWNEAAVKVTPFRLESALCTFACRCKGHHLGSNGGTKFLMFLCVDALQMLVAGMKP